mmetsp:Transcript_4282/g.8303  ORF Transcript_4282/g.8303 Transcript_4282/m.8303 type:complete len:89 (-) Transcript_4282:976-1242(-)
MFHLYILTGKFVFVPFLMHVIMGDILHHGVKGKIRTNKNDKYTFLPRFSLSIALPSPPSLFCPHRDYCPFLTPSVYLDLYNSLERSNV